jgi:UDP-N-acetylglucosamine:LPS N-acetylglucosamine transferase
VLEEANLIPHFFLERLSYLANDAQEAQKMVQAAKVFAKPNAAHVIASYILEYLRK